jgi:signal transduction histidine kinase
LQPIKKGKGGASADENALNQKSKGFLQSQKMEALSVLAGGIAHDFNNILQSILGYTQLAKFKKSEDDSANHYLVQIEEIIKIGTELNRQLLTFSQRIKPNFATLDLNVKIKETQACFIENPPNGITIELELSDNLDPIHADSIQMEQVLINLVKNAVEAMAEGGKLLIRTEKAHVGGEPSQAPAYDDYLRLTVSDNGCGLTPEILEHAFDPFFTTKGKGKGKGLGLALVYGIVKGHGGFVECSSRIGKGSEFNILLPSPPTSESKAHNASLNE